MILIGVDTMHEAEKMGENEPMSTGDDAFDVDKILPKDKSSMKKMLMSLFLSKKRAMASKIKRR